MSQDEIVEKQQRSTPDSLRLTVSSSIYIVPSIWRLHSFYLALLSIRTALMSVDVVYTCLFLVYFFIFFVCEKVEQSAVQGVANIRLKMKQQKKKNENKIETRTKTSTSNYRCYVKAKKSECVCVQ